MEQIAIYISLLVIIIFVGVIFDKATVPSALLLVIAGMLLSFIPLFSQIELSPTLILNIFLPLLLYQISSFASWKDVRKNFRPIALLSVGHVIFITILVAVVIHHLIPQLGWPLAFVLGAVISPPDDVAIVAIAEKIHMPNRIITILEGEGMLNDATALLLFRLALATVITHQFNPIHAFSTFFLMVIGETLYGIILGNIIGKIRLHITDSKLHMLASLLTPFLAYLPAEMLGGSGVLATVVTGFVIGEIYATKFTPEFRLLSRSIWPTLSFAILSFLFISIGLNLKIIIQGISSIPLAQLFLYGMTIVLTVILGRFVWVYSAAAIPRLLFPSIRKKDPFPPWQFPFIISWAGMRGAISLAAAFAVPSLPIVAGIGNPKYLLLFLVFCVIIATLIIQGLTLPYLLKILGVDKHGQQEKYSDHILELKTRLKLSKSVLRWLKVYKEEIVGNERLLDEIKIYIRNYKMTRKRLKERLESHHGIIEHDDEIELREAVFLSSQIIELERKELLRLWKEEKINLIVRNKLLEELDHKVKHIVT